jgi:hypothetical protein
MTTKSLIRQSTDSTLYGALNLYNKIKKCGKEAQDLSFTSSKPFKGIVRPFEFRGVTWLIRSGIINLRPGKFIFFFLMIKSHERSIEPFTAA